MRLRTKYETKATSSSLLHPDGSPVHPVHPEGEGWALVGAVPHTWSEDDPGVVWYWARTLSVAP